MTARIPASRHLRNRLEKRQIPITAGKQPKTKRVPSLGIKGITCQKKTWKKIQNGVLKHRLKEIGVGGREYVTRYCLDLEVETVATEVRIYADENGKCSCMILKSHSAIICPKRTCGYARTEKRWREGFGMKVGGRCIVTSSVL